MEWPPVDVTGLGTVVLGPEISCDGFDKDRGLRVQTHIHQDHMNDFDTSKKFEVIMSEETRELLKIENPDIDSRANIYSLKVGEEYDHNGYVVSFKRSNHMLGAVQVKVVTPEGLSLGYSGDFHWPLNDDAIEVDALVVDATYGSPDCRQKYTQESAEAAFIELIDKYIGTTNICIMADTGPAQRALQILALENQTKDAQIIGNKRFCQRTEVYRKCGYLVADVINRDNEDGIYIRGKEKHIHFRGLREEKLNDVYDGIMIHLTKFMTFDEPIRRQSDNVYTIGISNHADFDGTLEYIEATGAKYVVTDSYRQDVKARQLAAHLGIRNGLYARASDNPKRPAYMNVWDV